MTEQTQPSKSDQMRALIEELRTRLQTAAGGVDKRVQDVLAKMTMLMQPTPPTE